MYNQLEELTIYYETETLPKHECQLYIGTEILAYFNDQLVIHHQGTKYQSTTEMIYAMDQSIFKSNIPIDQYEFHFEDLSPDACLSFILFYCQHQGVSMKDFPFDWVDYSIRWELGDVKTTGKPFESWGCLHSALAHSFYIVEEQMDADGKMFSIIDQSNVLQGLKACLYLAISILLEAVAPYQVPDVDHIEEYNQAQTYLKMEYQKYLIGIKHATITQLELPMIDSKKALLVNAFITTENTYIGLLKSFLTHDEERTWLRSGFQFFAINRPELKGTGRDIVIQVDPQLKVHLKDLWSRLEELEDQRRISVQSFSTNATSQTSHVSWNDQKGTFQTLSAPKKSDDQAAGSYLEWIDVVSSIWELYNPAKSITVNPYLENGSIGQPCRIYECQPILSGPKYFTAVKWNSLGQQQVLVTSPTLQRYLAVCASRQYEDQIPPIYPLPSEKTFDFLEIPCGYTIIHPTGIFILDDWNNEELPLTLYKTEVKKLMKRVDTFQEVHQECIQIMTKVKSWLITGQALTESKLTEVNQWLSLNKVKIRHTILTTMFSSNDYYLQTFRETIEKRWAIHTQLNELYETITELEQMIESHTSLKTNRLIVLITIFGFPAVLFSGLFEIIFEQLPGPKWLGIHWIGLLLFFSLSLLSIWGLYRYLNRTPRNNHLDKSD